VTNQKFTWLSSLSQWLVILFLAWCATITLYTVVFGNARSRAEQEKLLPPAEYDYHYEGILFVHRAPMDKMDCNPKRLACAKVWQDKPICSIWIASDDDLKRYGYDYDIVLRHELGHCNGWRH